MAYLLWESKEQSDRFVQDKLLPSVPVEGGFTGRRGSAGAFRPKRNFLGPVGGHGARGYRRWRLPKPRRRPSGASSRPRPRKNGLAITMHRR